MFDISVFERAPIGLVVLDAETLVVEWANDTYLHFLNEPYRSEGIVGLNLEDYLPDARETGLLVTFRDVARTGVSYTSEEFAYEGFDRGRTYWNWSLHRIDATGGQGARLLIIGAEVTDLVLGRLAREEAFADLQMDYEFVARNLDQVNIPITYVDADLVYRLCNNAAARALGTSAERVVGYTLAEVVGVNTHVYHGVKQVIETGVGFEKVIHFKDADGGLRAYNVSWRPDVVDGRVVGAITAGVDITDLIEAQLDLHRARSETD